MPAQPAAAPASPAATAAAASDSPSHLGMVLLASPILPTADAVIAAYADIAGAAAPLTLADRNDVTLIFDVGIDETAIVALMPAPVPDGEADDAARFSLSGHAGWKLPAHRAHLIVRVSGPEGRAPIAVLRDATHVLAAITKASDAVGVYVGAASATHEPSFYVDTARRTQTPVMLWNGFSLAREPDGRLSLLSLGMKSLGLKDLLLTAPPDQGPAALEYFFTLLVYVADRGEDLPDGDTVGRTEQEVLPVRHVPSPLGDGRTVWRVDMP